MRLEAGQDHQKLTDEAGGAGQSGIGHGEEHHRAAKRGMVLTTPP